MAASGRDRSSGLQRGATGSIQKLPVCNMANLAQFKFLFFFFYISYVRGPLVPPLSRDIMPCEDEHLVFVIRGNAQAQTAALTSQ